MHCSVKLRINNGEKKMMCSCGAHCSMSRAQDAGAEMADAQWRVFFFIIIYYEVRIRY